jgi:uncharacterized protein YndB with AHSA1/START domain
MPNTPAFSPFDPDTDLRFERLVALPPEAIWAAWTTPALINQWFTPAPWRTSGCEIDLRPGGAFKTVMHSPEGASFPHVGCYLEIVPQARLVWTSAFHPGFRPKLMPPEDFAVTAIISLSPEGSGTRYTALALHADTATRDRHAAMGFEQGWGAALDQLIALMSQA